MDRPWAAALLVLVVVLSGCSGTTSHARQVSVTPAPVPTTGAATDASAGSLAPGLGADGVDRPAALADAHAGALWGSYTVHAEQTMRDANGSLRARRVVTVRLAANHSRYHAVIAVDGTGETGVFSTRPAHAEFWSDGERYMRAYTHANRTIYNPFHPTLSPGSGAVGTGQYWVSTVVPGGQPWQDILPLFRAFETRLVDPDGSDRRYRVASTRLARPAVLSRSERVVAPRNASLVAVVDPSGLVREYHLRYDGRIDGGTVRVERTIRYERVGNTTVDRPEWFEKALR